MSLLSPAEYRSRIRELSGNDLLTEMRVVLRHKAVFPTDADGLDRYAALYDLAHERGSTADGLWDIAAAEVRAEGRQMVAVK